MGISRTVYHGEPVVTQRGNNSMSSHISGIKSHFSKSKKVELSLGGGGGGGGGGWHQTPPTTTTSNFDKKNF